MPAYEVRQGIPPDMREALREHDDVTAALLYHRGVRDAESARAFLSPDFDARHDPFLLSDMGKAVEILYEAISLSRRIAVFCDYDADGVPGGAMFADFLKKVGHRAFEVYVPDRHVEGFGLSRSAVDEIASRGADLLITIDCGIADAEEAAHAKSLGMKVIVTDHHLPHGELPPADAVIDPKRADDAYPFKELCGAAVAWKLVEAFLSRHRAEFDVPEGYEKWLLDLVGIATLSDMVPLTGENRIFASYGLRVLRKTRRPGLAKLFEKLRLSRTALCEDDVTFMITPRINAASRLGESRDAFRLLDADDPAEAGALAHRLDKINDERKGAVAALVKDVKRVAEERLKERKVLVAGSPSWRPSLLGLAANSLVEAHGVPVFLWGRNGEDAIKGSCRGPDGVNLVALMAAAPEGTFSEFGGHAASGGFAVADDKIHFLEDALVRAAESLASAPSPAEPSYVEGVLGPDDLDQRLFSRVEPFGPFGLGNEKPAFLIRGAVLSGVRRFGKEDAHIELTVDRSSLPPIRAVAFFFSDEALPRKIAPGDSVDIVATLETSYFRNIREQRLRIIDIL